MADNEVIATQIPQLHEQFKELIEILQISPESRPILTESTLE